TSPQPPAGAPHCHAPAAAPSAAATTWPTGEQKAARWRRVTQRYRLYLNHSTLDGCRAAPEDLSFHVKDMGYPAEVCVGQSYSLKPPVERPTPSPPSHIWSSSILPTPNSDSSGSQDIAMPFHGAGPAGCTTLDCGAPGTNLMQTSDYLGGDFQTPYFRDQNLRLMGKMHRPPLSRVGPEVGDGRTALIQHPGYR
uniref:Uncharacterized protein n=1 Tax=Nothobranchius furzeri TaxID=105023 RepID=A0A8C6KPH7_NOTFU